MRMIAPTWWLERHPGVRAALRANQHVLTTHRRFLSLSLSLSLSFSLSLSLSLSLVVEIYVVVVDLHATIEHLVRIEELYASTHTSTPWGIVIFVVHLHIFDNIVN
jgi:hypothetical protein